jgi:hypothetical protein
MWKKRGPKARQGIFDAETLEVDDDGDINLPLEARNYGMHEKKCGTVIGARCIGIRTAVCCSGFMSI